MSFQGYDVAAALLKKDTQRKKKRYLLLLYSKRSSEVDIATIERAVQSSLREHLLIRLEDPDEALKLVLIKNIDLIIVDPEFLGDVSVTVEYAAEIKKRKKIPILFITEKEDGLINAYRRSLHLYEEADDYVLAPIDFSDAARRMVRMAESQGRSAKRFQVGVDSLVSRIDDWRPVDANINDISLVGMGLIVPNDSDFTRGMQLQVKIPLRRFGIFHHLYGDFLKVAVRVKRISIEGTTLGCSFEFLTPLQNECIVEILEYVAKRKKAFVKANAPKSKEVAAR